MVRTIKAGDQFPFSKGIITIKKVTKYRVRIGYSYFDTDEIITDLYEMTIEDFNNSKFAEIIDKGVY